MLQKIPLFLILSLVVLANAPTIAQGDNPVQYLQFFNNQYQVINSKNMEYLQYNVHSDDINLIEKKRTGLINQINQSLQASQALPPFKGDTTLKAGMIGILNDYLNAFQVDFKAINLLKQSSYESFKALEDYYAALDKAEAKLQENTKAFKGLQTLWQKQNYKRIPKRLKAYKQPLLKRTTFS